MAVNTDFVCQHYIYTQTGKTTSSVSCLGKCGVMVCVILLNKSDFYLWLVKLDGVMLCVGCYRWHVLGWIPSDRTAFGMAVAQEVECSSRVDELVCFTLMSWLSSTRVNDKHCESQYRSGKCRKCRDAKHTTREWLVKCRTRMLKR